MTRTRTLGLDPARAVGPERYRLGGRAPVLALRPASHAEVAEALRAAGREDLTVVPWGGGAGLVHEPSPESYDVALDLTAFDRVIEHQPEDFTLTAQCGVTLAALSATLAARGQELPIEAPRVGTATLGGVLAANTSGPRRLRLGSPRDRILGARFALADGTIAGSGGKVVKNVAGFALHRLLCGSNGGLAVLLEASLKLAPAPERRVALVYPLDRGALRDAARFAFLPRLEPSFATLLGGAAVESLARSGGGASMTGLGAGPILVVGLEDDEPWVARQEATIESALGRPAARVEGDAAAGVRQALCDAQDGRTASSAGADLHDARDLAGASLAFTSAGNTPAVLGVALDLPGLESFVFHAPAGRLHCFPEAARAAALALGLAELGFVPIHRRGLPEIEEALPPQQAVQALRRRLREALDPNRVFALGARWAAAPAMPAPSRG